MRIVLASISQGKSEEKIDLIDFLYVGRGGEKKTGFSFFLLYLEHGDCYRN